MGGGRRGRKFLSTSLSLGPRLPSGPTPTGPACSPVSVPFNSPSRPSCSGGSVPCPLGKPPITPGCTEDRLAARLLVTRLAAGSRVAAAGSTGPTTKAQRTGLWSSSAASGTGAASAPRACVTHPTIGARKEVAAGCGRGRSRGPQRCCWVPRSARAGGSVQRAQNREELSSV